MIEDFIVLYLNHLMYFYCLSIFKPFKALIKQKLLVNKLYYDVIKLIFLFLLIVTYQIYCIAIFVKKSIWKWDHMGTENQLIYSIIEYLITQYEENLNSRIG